MEEVSVAMGISRQAVQQIEYAAIRKLREFMKKNTDWR